MTLALWPPSPLSFVVGRGGESGWTQGKMNSYLNT